ncbi:hypothetical protein GCM10007426_18110 [Alloalcanivorax dieselolei]|nr:hypothetical protein GCM10007426_18110 [Alloalcanivorax dieselolei]
MTQPQPIDTIVPVYVVPRKAACYDAPGHGWERNFRLRVAAIIRFNGNTSDNSQGK